MVDKYTKEKKYDYDINANKVVNTDRDFPQRDNEPSGEPETLVGRQLHKFGDLAVKEKPPNTLTRKKNRNMIEKLIKKRTKSSNNNQYTDIGQNSILLDNSTKELLLYKPKTKDTLAIYEDLLNIVRKYFIDQPPEFIKSALDVIIASIKSDRSDSEKK